MRTTSPSSSVTRRVGARLANRPASADTIVVLPLPLSPVKNSTKPREERGGISVRRTEMTPGSASLSYACIELGVSTMGVACGLVKVRF